MTTKELKAHEDSLRRLLREELRSPFTRLDQINTLIQASILGDDWNEDRCEYFYSALQRTLFAAPELVAALFRASSAKGGEWIDVVPNLQPSPMTDEIKGLLEFIDDAADASEARLVGLGVSPDTTPHLVRVVVNAPSEGRRTGYVAVDFQVGNSPRTCYDRKDFDTADYPALLLFFIANVIAEELTHADDKSKPVRQLPMFIYHPERMRVSRPYLKGLSPMRVHLGKPLCTREQLNALAEAQHRYLFSHHLDMPIVDKERLGDDGVGFMFKEHDLAAMWLAYAGAGREIFDIPARLADLFALSDCDDLQLAQIRTPYKAQYIHFGPRQDLPLAPDWYCDGAYVVSDGGAMTVRFTACPSRPEEIMQWRMRAEPVVMLAFEPDDQPLDIGTAVDTAVARQLGELREEDAAMAQKQRDTDAAIADAGLEGVSVEVVTAKRIQRETAELLAAREVAHKALSLLVNALCYLTAYPDDVDHRWPMAAPDGLVEQLKGGTPGRRRRAEQQLHAEGFSKIRLCGRKFRESPTQNHPVAGMNRSHWRRGHFRSQAHGQGRQLRKIVWIMPVLVNATSMSEDTQLPGHLYLVQESSASSDAVPMP
ncbi:MAG: hypothetical protein ACRER5_02915 [Pseudomonas sp.]